MRAGNRPDAERYFQNALVMRPNLPGALLGLAELTFTNADYAGAKSYFMRYEKASVAPLSAENLFLAVRIERALGNRTAAASYAARLNRDFPASREAQMLKQLKLK